MTIRDAAEYLSSRGYRCSPGTVRAMVKADRIGHFRVGLGVGRIEIAESHLEAFLADQYRGPKESRPKVSRPAQASRPREAVPAVVRPDWRAEYEREKGRA
jgi:hypothetical protein